MLRGVAVGADGLYGLIKTGVSCSELLKSLEKVRPTRQMGGE